MTTSFAGIKPKLDVPSWQATPLIYSALHVAATSAVGSSLASDLRASQYANPNIYFLNSAAVFYQYNSITNGWLQQSTPALAGTFGAGAISVYAPSQGPRGTFTTPLSTTSITLSTALSTAVGINQLVGFRLRIVDNAGGASGTTTEVTVTGNTSGTTPTVYFAAITLPTTGGTYEFLTGRVFLLSAGTTAAGSWKYWDVCTSSYSGSLSTTNLAATTSVASSMVCLDELHTPITGFNGASINGETGGYFGNLTPTATTTTSLTGAVSGGDATVTINQFRNYQIRIVADTTTPTAVGQRRVITSHTAGASPVYTVATWTVQPTSTGIGVQYVIEHNNDILLWNNIGTSTYAYHPAANTWDTTTYAARSVTVSAGACAFHAFGASEAATDAQVKPSFIYSFRGGVTTTLDIFDFTAATTGTWSNAATYDNSGTVTFNASGGCKYSVVDNKAIVSPVSLLGTPVNMYYFDADKNSLKPYAPCQLVPSTIIEGDRTAVSIYSDGTTKKAFMYYLGSTINTMMRSLFIPQA